MFSDYQSMKYEYFSTPVFNSLLSGLPRNRFCLVTQRSSLPHCWGMLRDETKTAARETIFQNKWIRGNLRSHSATSAEPRKLLGNFKDRHIQWCGCVLTSQWAFSLTIPSDVPGREGYATRSNPLQPLTLLHIIFDRKGPSFVCLLLHDKWYPFHLPNLELSIPFNSCKCTVF